MKKEYISPSINIVKVQPRLLQSASPVENGYDPNSRPTTDKTSGNLSRRNGWGYDDEDEDDF